MWYQEACIYKDDLQFSIQLFLSCVLHLGSGKTLAYLLPIIDNLIRQRKHAPNEMYNAPRAVILVPAKELVHQLMVGTELELISKSGPNGHNIQHMINDKYTYTCTYSNRTPYLHIDDEIHTIITYVEHIL